MSIQSSITQPLSLTALLLTQAPAFKQAQQLGAAKTRVAKSNTAYQTAFGKYAAATTSEEKATLGKTMMKAAEEAVAERKDIAYLTGKEKDIGTYIEGTEKLANVEKEIKKDVSALAEEEVRAEAEELSRREAAESYEEELQSQRKYDDYQMARKKATESLARKQQEALESMRKTNPEAVAAYETIYGKGGMG